MNVKQRLATIVRYISIPPIMVSTLIVLLNIYRPDIFQYKLEIVISILSLGIIPLFAYPIQSVCPSLRSGGRVSQRKMAFIFSLIGYTFALIWALLTHVSNELLCICTTYFLSVIILTFINLVIKKRASGHACSVSGPLIFLTVFIDWRLLFPSLFIAFLIFWSSIYLKRHNKADLFGGVLANILAFFISYIFTIKW